MKAKTWILIAVSVILAVISQILMLYIPTVIGKLMTSLSSFLILEIIIIGSIAYGLTHISDTLFSISKVKAIKDITRQSLTRLYHADGRHLNDTFTISDTLTRHLDSVLETISPTSFGSIIHIVKGIVIIVYLYMLSSTIGLIAMFVSAMTYLSYIFLGKYYNIHVGEFLKKKGEVFATAHDLIHGRRDIHNLRIGDRAVSIANFKNLIKPSIKLAIENIFIFFVIPDMWHICLILFTMWYMPHIQMAYRLPAVMYTMALYTSSSTINYAISTFVSSIANIQYLKNILNVPPMEGEKTPPKTVEYIKLKNISIVFDREIIKNFSLDVTPPHHILIKGKSGSGKTTLLSIMAGDIEPDKGNVYINGKSLTELHKPTYWKRIYISYANIPIFKETVLYNASLGKNEDMARKLLHKLCPHLDPDRVITSEHQLSGGEKKVLALIRGLLHPSSILLLDEPFSGMDKELYHRSTNLIRESNKGTVIVSHRDIEELPISTYVNLG